MRSASEMVIDVIDAPMEDWYVTGSDSDPSLADRLSAIWAEELERVAFGGTSAALRRVS